MDETEKIAQEFLEMISIKVKPFSATVVGLQGDLGSGKTTFTKIIGNLLGVKETIQSPTFVIQKIYKTNHPIFKNFYHIDLYRIEDPNEIKVLNLEEVFQNPQNLVFIEWPERAGNLLPNMIHINFEFVDETTRNISYAIQ